MSRIFAALLAASLYPATVARVIDGDTFVADLQLRPGLTERVTVRLPCGDAPELRQDGGVEARALLSALTLGMPIQISTSWRTDKYGRVLAEPLVDGGSVCAAMRDAGVLR